MEIAAAPLKLLLPYGTINRSVSAAAMVHGEKFGPRDPIWQASSTEIGRHRLQSCRLYEAELPLKQLMNSMSEYSVRSISARCGLGPCAAEM